MSLTKIYRLFFPTLPSFIVLFSPFLATATPQDFNIKGGLNPAYINQSERVFGKPGGLSVTPNGAYLLIADPVANEVKVFDTGRLRHLSQFGKGELSNPHDLSFDHQGRLLVADTKNNRIMIYKFEGVYRDGDPNVEHVATLSDGLHGPSSITAGAGNRLFVINSANGSLVLMNEGIVVKTITSAGSSNTPLDNPIDIHLTTNNRVLVSDSGNNRILVFDTSLNFVRELASIDYGFSQPGRIASDENGMILISDGGSNSVNIVDMEFKLRGKIRTDSPPNDQMKTPGGVETVGRYMWVSDTGNGRVILFKRQ